VLSCPIAEIMLHPDLFEMKIKEAGSREGSCPRIFVPDHDGHSWVGLAKIGFL